MMKPLTVAVTGLLVTVVFQGTALAQVQYPNVKASVWAGVQCRCVLSDDDTFSDPVFGTVELMAAKSAFGFGGDLEVRLAKFFGVDVALGYSSTTVKFSHTVGAGVQEDNLGMMPLFFGANLHVVNTGRVDAYVGYLAAYMFYLNDVSFTVPGTGTYSLPSNNEFTAKGFSFGADIAANDKWAVNLAFRMVNADADSGHLLALDPTFITVGVTRKF